jgi:glycosyltransferase involved in cell wall biosynthesis
MKIRLLHVFSTFDPGGPQVRTVDIMNSLGPEWQHLIVARDGRTGAAALIAPDVQMQLLSRAEGTGGGWGFRDLLRTLREHSPHLLLTYNWGAIEAVAAAKWNGGPPAIHAEDGFGPDEARRRKTRRVWARRLVLRSARRVVVPSSTLYRIAVHEYKLPSDRVVHIPNGVCLERFHPRHEEELRAELGFSTEQTVIGFVGHLREEKNVGLLIRAVARMRHPNPALLIVGDGPCRKDLEELAAQSAPSGRVRFVGKVSDPSRLFGVMDLFCLCSNTEQMPVALLEAMATGLAAVVTSVGDCGSLLDRSSPPFLVPPGDVDALTEALDTVAADRALRADEGARLRERCLRHFNRRPMLERYKRLYLECAGREQTE